MSISPLRVDETSQIEGTLFQVVGLVKLPGNIGYDRTAHQFIIAASVTEAEQIFAAIQPDIVDVLVEKHWPGTGIFQKKPAVAVPAPAVAAPAPAPAPKKASPAKAEPKSEPIVVVAPTPASEPETATETVPEEIPAGVSEKS